METASLRPRGLALRQWPPIVRYASTKTEYGGFPGKSDSKKYCSPRLSMSSSAAWTSTTVRTGGGSLSGSPDALDLGRCVLQCPIELGRTLRHGSITVF